MNWRSGLLRTWAVASAAWLIGWAAYVWNSCELVPFPTAGGHVLVEVCRVGLGEWMSQPAHFSFGDYASMVGIGLGVPLSILALGFGIGWILDGFGVLPSK